MKKYFIAFSLAFILFSCNDKTQNTIEDLWENFSFNNTVSNSTQIIIKAYDSTLTNKRIQNLESYIPIKEFKTRTKKQVRDFEKIFINAEKTDYCCCPRPSYSIHFLNQKEELDVFNVDTLEFKNKVRIFEGSYQFSYIIEKQKWKEFLNELEN